MKRKRIKAAVISLCAVTALSGSEPESIYVHPRVILAEERAKEASVELLRMDYLGAVHSYEDALPKISSNSFHRRMYGRALAHVGLWEEAARNLQLAALSEELQVGVEADQNRLRALERGIGGAAPESPLWRQLAVVYAQDNGVGPVTILDDGAVVTAHPAQGRIGFWSESGRRQAFVAVGGTPVGLARDRNRVWTVDLAGNRLLLVSREGVERSIDLAAQGVFGPRAVSRDEDGFLWVADYGGGRILRLSPDGEMVTQIGAGELNDPVGGLALPARGAEPARVLVAEAGIGQVRAYDRNGRFLRSYTHEAMGTPANLAAAGTLGDFIVQSRDGKIFWERAGRLEGPVTSDDGPLATASLGVAIDRWNNLWWGDGRSLMFAQMLPAGRPYHLVEVLRGGLDPGSSLLDLTVSVMTPDGRPIENLDEGSFRLVRGDRVLTPLKTKNLSRTLLGRRMIVARESSLPVEEHRPWIDPLWERFLASLTSDDRTAVMDIADSYTVFRPFAVSSALVRNALREDRPTAATIDLRNFAAIDYAVRLLTQLDEARALVWLTSGEGLQPEEVRLMERMAVINQVPFFIVHVTDANSGMLATLAERSGGDYFRLYQESSTDEFIGRLGAIRSGRYRLAAKVPRPNPLDQGIWIPYLVEAHYKDETAFDQFGFYVP